MTKPNREIVRAEVPSSGDVGCLPIGPSFTRFAASWHIVCRLKKIITLPPTTTVITFFTDFTRASEVPFLLRSIGWKKSPFHSFFRAGRGQLVPSLAYSLLLDFTLLCVLVWVLVKRWVETGLLRTKGTKYYIFVMRTHASQFHSIEILINCGMFLVI